MFKVQSTGHLACLPPLPVLPFSCAERPASSEVVTTPGWPRAFQLRLATPYTRIYCQLYSKCNFLHRISSAPLLSGFPTTHVPRVTARLPPGSGSAQSAQDSPSCLRGLEPASPSLQVLVPLWSFGFLMHLLICILGKAIMVAP